MRRNQRRDHNQFQLQSGEPCRRYGCSRCCIDTQMSLTQQDIRKIIEAGFQPSEFRIRKEGEWRLTNQKASGPCVFLKNTKCQIYESRPTGCRIYPLVFDETLKQAVVDFLCPFGFDFFVTDADRHKLFALIKQLDNENRSDQLSDQ